MLNRSLIFVIFKITIIPFWLLFVIALSPAHAGVEYRIGDGISFASEAVTASGDMGYRFSLSVPYVHSDIWGLNNEGSIQLGYGHSQFNSLALSGADQNFIYDYFDISVLSKFVIGPRLSSYFKYSVPVTLKNSYSETVIIFKLSGGIEYSPIPNFSLFTDCGYSFSIGSQNQLPLSPNFGRGFVASFGLRVFPF